MESPFRSEAAAFRFLLITIGAFALIVIMSSISTVLGFLTFLVAVIQLPTLDTAGQPIYVGAPISCS